MNLFFYQKTDAPEIVIIDGFQVVIVRTERKKTASIKIKEGNVVITVPKSMPQSEAKSLLLKKSNWINKQLSLQKQAATLTSRNYVEGEFFSYRGKPRYLSIHATRYPGQKILDDRILLSLTTDEFSQELIKELITQLFRESAEQHLKERTEQYAKKIAVQPSDIRIKQYKSRWGSCSIRGQISYNWRIIMAPDPIIDYVVVHELCHLIEHNHSPRFWKLVEQFSPNYREHRNWLRENGLLLVV